MMISLVRQPRLKVHNLNSWIFSQSRNMCSPVITVVPEDTLTHEKVQITIHKALPNQPYTLHFNAFNGLRLNTDSITHFKSDSNGIINLEENKPLETSPDIYSKVIESMSLFRVMRFRPGFEERSLNTDVFSPLSCKLDLHEGLIDNLDDALNKQPVASKTFTRSFVKPGLRREVIRQGRVKGTLFLPPITDNEQVFPGIITLHGGIHRGHEIEDIAAYLANHGFASMALAYFSVDGLPSLYEGPFDLGYVEEAIDLLLDVSINLFKC